MTEGRAKLLIRALALGIVAALAAGAALAADRGECRYDGYDGYSGSDRCGKRPQPVIDLGSSTGRKGGPLQPSAEYSVNAAEVVWDLDGDGQYDDAAGQWSPQMQLPSDEDEHTLGLRVTDPHGRSATARRTFSLHDANVAPDIYVERDYRAGVPVGSPYEFWVVAADEDDPAVDVTIDFGDGTPVHQARTDGDDGIDVEHPYAAAGRKIVRVTASDGQHTTELAYTIRIGAAAGARDPVFDYPWVTPPRAGQAIQLSESAEDPDGSALTWAWDLDGDGQYDDGSAPEADYTPAAGARATWGVRITDGNGGEAWLRKTVMPRNENLGPEAGVFVDPDVPKAGVPVDVYGYGWDPDDGSDVTLTWDIDGDGQFDDHAGDEAFEHTFPAVGTHSVGLRVADGEGAVAVERIDVVVSRSAPTGSVTWLPSRPQPGEQITFTGTGSDPDGGDVELEWDLDGDVQWDDADGETATRSFADEDWHPVSLRITDEDDDVEVITRYVPVGDVVNHRPRAGVTFSPAAPRAGEPVTFTSTTTDPDGDALTHYWELDGDDDYDDGSAATAARTFPAAGTYLVALYVEDDRGGWDEVAVRVTVGAPRPTGGGPTAPPAADTTAPTIKVNAIARRALKLGTVVGKGLKVPVTCSEACTASLELRADKATARRLKIARKAVVVGRASGQVGANGTLTVKLTSKARKRLKKAKKVKLTLQGTARDAAGNASALPTRTLTLRK